VTCHGLKEAFTDPHARSVSAGSSLDRTMLNGIHFRHEETSPPLVFARLTVVLSSNRRPPTESTTLKTITLPSTLFAFVSLTVALTVAACSDDPVVPPAPAASSTSTVSPSVPDASTTPTPDASTTASPDAATPPSLPAISGTWRTGCSAQTNDGRTTYSISELSEKAGVPRFTFTTYADAACTTKFFSIGNESRRTVGKPVAGVAGAFELDVAFQKLFAVAHSPAAAAQLRSASCGTGDFAVDVEKDVTQSGCLFFQPISACGFDYDIVKVEGDKLYNGVRGEDQCVVAGRPKSLNAYFFAKVQ
jgi:hypothetical protein